MDVVAGPVRGDPLDHPVLSVATHNQDPAVLVAEAAGYDGGGGGASSTVRANPTGRRPTGAWWVSPSAGGSGVGSGR